MNTHTRTRAFPGIRCRGEGRMPLLRGSWKMDDHGGGAQRHAHVYFLLTRRPHQAARKLIPSQGRGGPESKNTEFLPAVKRWRVQRASCRAEMSAAEFANRPKVGLSLPPNRRWPEAPRASRSSGWRRTFHAPRRRRSGRNYPSYTRPHLRKLWGTLASNYEFAWRFGHSTLVLLVTWKHGTSVDK